MPKTVLDRDGVSEEELDSRTAGAVKVAFSALIDVLFLTGAVAPVRRVVVVDEEDLYEEPVREALPPPAREHVVDLVREDTQKGPPGYVRRPDPGLEID